MLFNYPIPHSFRLVAGCTGLAQRRPIPHDFSDRQSRCVHRQPRV